MTTWYEEVIKHASHDNTKAFLDTISHSEGTDLYGDDYGYNVIVGGGLFYDYSDHPRVLVDLPNLGIKSSAAGRYQVLERYYDHYKDQLGLPNFGHDSQDAIAIQLIRECKALDDIEEGRIETAIRKCRSRWASFPGAGYGQHERDIRKLLGYYVQCGGRVA